MNYYYDDEDLKHFEYTKDFNVQSSLIDDVYYNENDGTAVLDVNDELYRYFGVTEADVSALVRANSTGAHYNTVFKKAFGPGEHLGNYTEFEATHVSVVKRNDTPTTPKGLYSVDTNGVPTLSVAPGTHFTSPPVDTKEFSLNVFDQSVSGAPIATAETDDVPTKEFSLTLVENDPVGIDDTDAVRIRVHFTLKDFDKVYKFDAKALNVEDAIEELHDHISLIGTTGKVKKVVIKFD